MPVIFSELGGPMSESFHKQLIEQRRHLHQYPEVGWTEFQTRSIPLRDIGVNVFSAQ